MCVKTQGQRVNWPSIKYVKQQPWSYLVFEIW